MPNKPNTALDIVDTSVMDNIDNVLTSVEETGSMEYAHQAIDKLLGIQLVSGKGLAKLLYGLKRWWDGTNQGVIQSDNFFDNLEVRHNLKKVTVDRYICVWGAIITNKLPEYLVKKPLRDLIPISKALEQGYEITEDVFVELHTANSAEIRAIIRRVKEQEPRKSARQFKWERSGDVVVWKENKRHFLGWLDREGFENDEIVHSAILTLLDNRVIVE
jgi:hypothetical protein